MTRMLGLLTAVLLAAPEALAEGKTFEDPLIERLVGQWVLRGTIDGKETTHDVTAEWVLGHHYVRLHEVSREKDAKGRPAYEAMVFIGWDQPSGRYACLWLDSTGGGGLSAGAIGYAARGGDAIPFVFKAGDGSLFHTTFSYSKGTDTWRWHMDAAEAGKLQPFARVSLTRK